MGHVNDALPTEWNGREYFENIIIMIIVVNPRHFVRPPHEKHGQVTSKKEAGCGLPVTRD